jgi:hypothetical protein
MKALYFTLALAVMCVLGMATSSQALDTDGIVVTVPFEFVAGTNIMPAGTYKVGRFSDDPHSGVILRNGPNTAVVLPMTVEGASTLAPKANLFFKHSGGRYFLGEIETPGIVYTLATPRPVVIVAGTHDQNTTPAGTN